MATYKRCTNRPRRFPLKFEIKLWQCCVGNSEDFKLRDFSDEVEKICYVEEVMHIIGKRFVPLVAAPISRKFEASQGREYTVACKDTNVTIITLDPA